ncbi:MAG: hypothetical protein ACFBWO_11865 [Paracoccaceae bacterium]
MFRTLLAATALAALPFGASALTIDTFETSQAVSAGNSGTVSGAGIIGGSRTLEVQANGTSDGRIDFFGNNRFNATNETDSTGTFTLTYDAGGAGLGGIDFQADGSDVLAVRIFQNDQFSDYSFTLTDTDGDSDTVTLEDQPNVPPFGPLINENPPFSNSPQDLIFSFSSFDNAVNLNSIDSVTFVLANQFAGADTLVTFIETRDTVPGIIPLPAPALLLLTGLVGLGAVRHGRRA